MSTWDTFPGTWDDALGTWDNPQIGDPGRIAISDSPTATVSITTSFMTYDIGDVARLNATFTNEITGTVADPTTVTLTVKPPQSVAVVYTYGVGGTIVKVSTGVYRADITLTEARRWRYKWKGTGDLAAAELGSVYVRPDSV
jgi:hypothetical protein